VFSASIFPKFIFLGYSVKLSLFRLNIDVYLDFEDGASTGFNSFGGECDRNARFLSGTEWICVAIDGDGVRRTALMN
jgi:hypothetical protein